MIKRAYLTDGKQLTENKRSPGQALSPKARLRKAKRGISITALTDGLNGLGYIPRV